MQAPHLLYTNCGLLSTRYTRISYYYTGFYKISTMNFLAYFLSKFQLLRGPCYLDFFRYYGILIFSPSNVFSYVAWLHPYIYFRLSPCTWVIPDISTSLSLRIFIYNSSGLLRDLLYYLATCIYCLLEGLELLLSWASYYLQPIKFLCHCYHWQHMDFH